MKNTKGGDGQERNLPGVPPKQGLYDPRFEHDACGVGMVVNIDGKKSHDIVRQALTVLANLTHRGARGSEVNTGDGAGILMQVPHAFLKRKAERHGFTLPDPGQYGVGMVFMPPDVNHRRAIEIHFEKVIASEGQRVLGWRTVKVNNSAIGNAARRAEPKMRMVFIARNPIITDDMAFERKLYVIRKRAENEIRYGDMFEGYAGFRSIGKLFP
jgi:glutamate synthase (NADPH/NADH) large chain